MYEDGVVHGVAKAWATDGRFLGEYTLDHGTGLAKKWHDNGIPWLEVPFVNGLPTGRQHTWYEDGEPAPDIYWIKGKKVSRKKYHEACKMDSELPYYPESKSK
jgi:antitoxin component YwqK of YwqJK toxin-antitoxin module